MAANLTYNTRGEAQMAYFGETPWHGEGYQLTSEETHDFDSIFGKVEFDYPMSKLPYFRPAGANWIESPDCFYIMRNDTSKILGNVGSDYEIVPNREAFNTLKPLVDTGVATIETGGVLRDGADAWLMVRWDMARMSPLVQEVFNGELVPFSACMVNHNGRRGIMIGNTPIRIVCSNTLGMAESHKLSRWQTVKHSDGASSKLVTAAEEMFANVIQRYEVLATQYKKLKETALTSEAFDRMVLDVIAPKPESNPKFNPEAKLAHVVSERANRKRSIVRNLWTNGKGHTGEQNAWFAYNAAVEAIDHNTDLWPQRGGSWRTQKLLVGDLAKLKDKVVDGLVNYAMGV